MSTYTPIAIQTLGTAAASVTFSSIPQGYTDLILVVNGLVSSNSAAAWLGFNADTSSLYSSTRLTGSGSTAATSRFAGRTNSNNWYGGSAAGLSNTNNNTVVLQIQSYSNATTFKTWLSRTAGLATETVVGLYRSTSPITTITLGVESAFTYSTGTTFSLYGIAVGNSSAKADGGSNVTTDGTYYYHTFKSSGAFIPRQALTVDYLVVAGGAGGGYSQGGGGGAGGLRCTVGATGGGGSLESALSLSKDTSYPVIIGAGGIGSTSMQPYGANGTNSIFSTITSTGGGGGATGGQNGQNGGSGGGAGNGGSIGTGTSGQGNNGGTAYNGGNYYGGGGGGGAGAVGGNGSSSAGGNGGNGVTTSISGTSTTYAGGGGAGTFTGGTAGTGGSGGGGNAGNYSTGQAGFAATANTGSGGGGSSYGPSFPGSAGVGGNGGSGLVIIRYAV
jgi:hypothetical protein